MKEKIPQPAPVSRTLQGKAKEPNTASVADVLQAYKNGIVQQQAVDEEDELLQGKFETTQREELEDDELFQGKFETTQRDELEDDELLQGKFETAQRDELEDDELLQGKFETAQREELEDDELLQGKFETAQREELEDDELLQGKFETAQREELKDEELLQGKFETTQHKEAPNNTGLPDTLKAGVEQLSGLDMSDVKVHYNSSKPAGVQAYAYTQGTDIHVAPGQEKHLGHEAWHVAQQKQGRVQPTTTVGGIAVNDNAGLEKEADVMGGKAVQMKPKENKRGAVGNDIGQKKSDGKQKNGDNHREVIVQRELKKLVNCSSKFIKFVQRAPAAQGFLGDDEDFLQQALNFIIVPTRVRMKDEGDGGTLFMIDFPVEHQCQIHIHEAFDGEINGAHIKSNAGNFRHGMNSVDAILYLDNLNELHSQGAFPLEQM